VVSPFGQHWTRIPKLKCCWSTRYQSKGKSSPMVWHIAVTKQRVNMSLTDMVFHSIEFYSRSRLKHYPLKYLYKKYSWYISLFLHHALSVRHLNRKNLWPVWKWKRNDYNSYAKPQRIANVINNVILALTCTPSPPRFPQSARVHGVFERQFKWVRLSVKRWKGEEVKRWKGSGQSLGLNVNNNNATATIVMMK